ncbi:hypothetical protein HYY74_07835 [Candidatus Woesearchaeota archaeon]|nr:hypothetical protein [Candidatus Woesearchaeota archaeon]
MAKRGSFEIEMTLKIILGVALLLVTVLIIFKLKTGNEDVFAELMRRLTFGG